MLTNLIAVREMSGNLVKVRELSGENFVRENVSQNVNVHLDRVLV